MPELETPPAIWDVHAHFIPPNVVAAAETGRFGMRIEDGKLVVPGATIPLAQITDFDALLGWMDERLVFGAVLSIPPPLYRYDLEPAAAAEWTGLVKDGLQSVAGEASDRLRFLAHLPLQSPELAAEETGDETPGLRSGFSIGTSLGDLTLDDPFFEPVFQRLDETGQFVLIHPVECPDPRLDRYYLGNLLGNPYETSLAAACLVFSGMLSRYENIRFCLAHAGGAAPCLVGRWQHGYDTERPGISPLRIGPREALRRLWFDSVAHGEPALKLLLEEVGADRVLLGSDYPFPMREDAPVASLEGLPEEDRVRISGGNLAIALGRFSKVSP